MHAVNSECEMRRPAFIYSFAKNIEISLSPSFIHIFSLYHGMESFMCNSKFLHS